MNDVGGRSVGLCYANPTYDYLTLKRLTSERLPSCLRRCANSSEWVSLKRRRSMSDSDQREREFIGRYK